MISRFECGEGKCRARWSDICVERESKEHGDLSVSRMIARNL